MNPSIHRTGRSLARLLGPGGADPSGGRRHAGRPSGRPGTLRGGLAGPRCTVSRHARTATAVTAKAVTAGVHAGESADGNAGHAAAGDGRAHAPTKVVPRGVGSGRSVQVAWARRLRGPVPGRLRRPTPGQTPIRGGRTAKVQRAESPMAARTRAAAPRFAHPAAQRSPPELEAPSRRRARRAGARTRIGEATGR
jgi:hypothetical protein